MIGLSKIQENFSITTKELKFVNMNLIEKDNVKFSLVIVSCFTSLNGHYSDNSRYLLSNILLIRHDVRIKYLGGREGGKNYISMKKTSQTLPEERERKWKKEEP